MESPFRSFEPRERGPSAKHGSPSNPARSREPLRKRDRLTDHGTPVTPGGFARFYAPLAATSLLLTATNPILTAALGRSTDPTIALAGFGVAFPVCGVLYAPLLVIQQVAAARLLGGGSFSPVRRFAYLTGAVLSVAGAVIAYTSAGDWVFGSVVAVGPRVQAEAMRAMGFLWPVPFLTAVRASHQGRLVAGHRTRPIAAATGGRTGVLAVAAVLAVAVTGGGAWLGAAAFTAGLVVETLWVVWSPTPGLKLEQSGCETDRQNVARFSAPLMANVLLWWATPLIVGSVLARTANPDPALAAFTVVEAVAWFVAAPVGQMQHASIALVKCSDTHRQVRAWGVGVAAATMALLLALSVPAVREPVFRLLFALEPHLIALAGPALPLTAAYPVLYGLRQYYQGLFVRSGKTGFVGVGAVLRVIGIGALAATAFALGFGADPSMGAVMGVGLAVSGLVVEGVFLVACCGSAVMPELKAHRAAAVNPGAFEGAA